MASLPYAKSGTRYRGDRRNKKIGGIPCSQRPTSLDQSLFWQKNFTPTKHTRPYYNSFLLLSANCVPNVILGTFQTFSLMLTLLMKGRVGYRISHRRLAERFGALPEVARWGQGNAQIGLQRPNQAGEQFSPCGRRAGIYWIETLCQAF